MKLSILFSILVNVVNVDVSSSLILLRGFSTRKQIQPLQFARRNRDLNVYDDVYEDPYQKYEHQDTFEKFLAKSNTQQLYLDAIQNEDIKLVIASGPAGTGKTLFPTQYAAKLLSETNQKIVLTRPLISVDEELGYLPGNIHQKMDPWIIPIFDVLREFFTQKEINYFVAEKRLDIVPLAFMRGRTFKDTFIIGDELQNTSCKQMLMLLTRIGENSKMVITGDIDQCDNTENGLLDLLQKINLKYDNNASDNKLLIDDIITLIKLEESDIQRSVIISKILDIYNS